MSKNAKKAEYGDFQTPEKLAHQVCRFLKKSNVTPRSIIEPTCGVGSFFMKALSIFDEAREGYACDINDNHIEVLKNKFLGCSGRIPARIETADFFSKDWESDLCNLPEPILVIGNPPWVTNSQLGQLGSDNLPAKLNHKKMKGLDALTGKSNFDISEWMINRMVEWIQKKQGTVAMLCKTSVARKVLLNAWKNDKKMEVATMHLIDSKLHFQISADACLLTVTSSDKKHKECKVYDHIEKDNPVQSIGLRDYFLVADIHGYERTKHLIENGQHYKWRTGIKHDCSRVMELERIGEGVYVNGFGDTTELEDLCLYPLLKGSNLANEKTPEKFMLVPQTRIGQETKYLAETAPKTLEYLIKYGDLLDRRVSSIYKSKPRFSVFGVGDYAFSSWKVAIPALYKQLKFFVVGPHEDKAVVFDDTVNFIAMENFEESYRLAKLLNSDIANIFYRSFIFWDSKRPITVQLLRSLDIDGLMAELGNEYKYSISKTSRQLQLI